MVSVHEWTALRVNQTEVRARPGGTIPVCQAIPYTALTAHLRTTAPRGRVRVRLRVPGRPSRVRVVRLARRSRVTFGGDFPQGTYRLAVRRHGRTLARAALHVRGGGTC
jgi:hypothetical protein